ncbi:MAG: hypothetical protein DRZ82_08710 [Thermoprotei archaeon]|nr:MAG: hypothetical protein DRZ82_08710 [Thermoprotei archaeon]
MLVSIGAIILALLIGMTAAILGIGGGVFLVPTLHMILGLDMHSAVGTSLFIIFFLSSTAAISYSRKKLIMWKLALIFECGSTIGAYMGARISNILPSKWLRTCFSIVLLYTAFRMWQKAGREKQENVERKQLQEEYNLRNLTFIFLLIFLGFIAGFLSGLLGIGGGVVKVPIMRLILGMAMHNAVATSVFMISITSSVGSATHFMLKNVDYLLGLTLAPFVIIGSHIGTRIAVKLKGATISRLFAALLAFVAIRMIIG